MPTKIIDNFSGRLTRQSTGDMNSGLAKYATTFGNDPFTSPSDLTWMEAPLLLNQGGNVISDLVVAARPRLENGITYVYAIGHTGRLYKIQVNDPVTHNSNYDVPVLLTTLTINSPTFKYGSSIQFYGSTEKLFIGHDLGVTKVNFDGTGEAFVGVLGSYTANVPRPSANFLGKLEFGNGANLVEIDQTELVTTYAKLVNPTGFPSGTYTRDMDVSPDGIYLQIIVSRLNSPDLTSVTQDTTSLSSTDSYKFLWNGTDTGYTSYESFNGYTINANVTYGPYSYTMGYDLGGAAIYAGGQKIVSLINSLSPNFGSMFSTGNLMGFAASEYVSSIKYPTVLTNVLAAAIIFYGQYDEEIPKGLYRFLRMSAGFFNGSDTDIIRMPVCLTVSNLFFGASSAGYTNNRVGSAKLYFSTVETSGSNTSYGFYRFNTVPTGFDLETTPAIQGVYETQQETSFKLFRSIVNKKFKVNEVRVYGEPWTGNVTNGTDFQIDLIGSDGKPISGGTFEFYYFNSVGDTLIGGTDYGWYNPKIEPVASLGLRISNLDNINFTITKVEIDYEEAGK